MGGLKDLNLFSVNLSATQSQTCKALIGQRFGFA
jgi:hypothetical protein